MQIRDLPEESKVPALFFLQENISKIISGTMQAGIELNEFYLLFSSNAANDWLSKLLPLDALNEKASSQWLQVLLNTEVKVNSGQIFRNSTLAKYYLVQKIISTDGFLSANKAQDIVARFNKAKDMQGIFGNDSLPDIVKAYYKTILIPALDKEDSIAKTNPQRAIDITHHLSFNIIGTVLNRFSVNDPVSLIKFKGLCSTIKNNTKFAEAIYGSIVNYQLNDSISPRPATSNFDLQKFEEYVRAEVAKLSLLSRTKFNLYSLKGQLAQKLSDVTASSNETPPTNEASNVSTAPSARRDLMKARRTASIYTKNSEQMSALQEQLKIIETLQVRIRSMLNTATENIAETLTAADIPNLPGTEEVTEFTKVFHEKLGKLDAQMTDFSGLLSILEPFVEKTQIITSKLKEYQDNSFKALIERLASTFTNLLISSNPLSDILSFAFRDNKSNYKDEACKKLIAALREELSNTCLQSLSKVFSDLRKNPNQLKEHTDKFIEEELLNNVFPNLREKQQKIGVEKDAILTTLILAIKDCPASKNEHYEQLRKDQIYYEASRLLYTVFSAIAAILVEKHLDCHAKSKSGGVAELINSVGSGVTTNPAAPSAAATVPAAGEALPTALKMEPSN